MNENENEWMWGYEPTPYIRWAKVKSNMRQLEQLWRNPAGMTHWREVPWADDKEPNHDPT